MRIYIDSFLICSAWGLRRPCSICFQSKNTQPYSIQLIFLSFLLHLVPLVTSQLRKLHSTLNDSLDYLRSQLWAISQAGHSKAAIIAIKLNSLLPYFSLSDYCIDSSWNFVATLFRKLKKFCLFFFFFFFNHLANLPNLTNFLFKQSLKPHKSNISKPKPSNEFLKLRKY